MYVIERRKEEAAVTGMCFNAGCNACTGSVQAEATASYWSEIKGEHDVPITIAGAILSSLWVIYVATTKCMNRMRQLTSMYGMRYQRAHKCHCFRCFYCYVVYSLAKEI